MSGAGWPQGFDSAGKFISPGELAAQATVRADKIRVAKAANGCAAVLLTPRPQIATGKAAENRRAACIGPLALQGVENFLDLITHALLPAMVRSKGETAKKKQAATRVGMTMVTRFLYMVVLYMAPEYQTTSAPGQHAGEALF
jgi:hypothetical protein